ncbi:MAG: ribbon-helix-helix domain-containing protein [Propionibacteriaceae bacterium]|nr:ribbon-helix-helix domain-containing protein [Propionibacteriaceae bacterium]
MTELKPRMTEAEARAYLATMTDEDFPTISREESGITDDLIERLVEAAHQMVAGRPSLTAPGKHSPQITVRFAKPVYERLADLAKRTGRRRSQVVRDAVNAYLDWAEGPGKPNLTPGLDVGVMA